MSVHPLAGKPAPRSLLVNVPRLVAAYFAISPDPNDPAQQVKEGAASAAVSARWLRWIPWLARRGGAAPSRRSQARARRLRSRRSAFASARLPRPACARGS